MRTTQAGLDLDASTLRRCWMFFSMLLLALACSAPNEPDRGSGTKTVSQASTIGETEIQKKWEALGGAAVVGNPIEPLTEIIAGRWEFRKFQNGVIVWSNEHGAMFLSTPVFTKWTGLILFNTQSGQNAMEAIGAPIRDEKRLADSEEAWFHHGVIFGRTMPSGQHRILVVMGAFFNAWVKNRNAIGLPIDEEQDVIGVPGGRLQKFHHANLYLKPFAQEAFAVISGMRDKSSLSGVPHPASFGFPISDTRLVLKGSQAIGYSQQFEHADLYLRSDAEKPIAVKGNLREGYRKHGGPAGWLGFPITGTIARGLNGTGDFYNDFEGGLLVDHVAVDAHTGVIAFKSLTFMLERIASSDSEFACGVVDLYADIHVSPRPTGQPKDVRVPSGDGEVGSDALLNHPVVVKEIADGNTEVDVSVHLTDDDGGLCLGGESLGTALETYSLDNLFGLLLGHDYPTRSHEGSGKVTMTMKDSLPYDPTDFRGTQFWSWHNYSQPTLTDDEFAATYVDVSPDESVVLNPYNKFFFETVYEELGEDGLCFGMCLESIDASYDVSAYGEPIYRYYQSHAGSRLPDIPDATGGTRSLIKTINIKHGFQLGLIPVRYVLGLLNWDLTTNPVAVYEALESYKRTDILLAMLNEELPGSGHVVRPYAVRDGAPGDCSLGTACKVIDVADGNHPKVPNVLNATHVEIYPDGNVFRYTMGPDWPATRWEGSPDQGGRLYLLPYSLFAGPQLSPASEFWEVIGDLVKIILDSDNGSVRQISDQQGRTVFEPGLTVLPTRWDQLRRDQASRTPYLYPIPQFGGGGTTKAQMYAGHATGGTLTFEIERNPSNFAQAPYPMLYQSAMLSSLLEVDGTVGKADRITARDIGTPGESMTFALPPDGEPKQITWTISGAKRSRWKRFTELWVRPNQSLTIKVENGGKNLIVDNDGPLTTGVLTVAGMGALEETLGTMVIWPGTNNFDVASPHLTANVEGNGFPWSRTPVTVTLMGTAVSGWSTATVEYSTDGVTWTPYTGPFTYAVEGVSTLHYRARDDQANVTTKSREIMIDTIRPETVVNIVPNGFSYMVKDFTPGSGFQTFHAVVTNKNGEVTTVDLSSPNGTVPLTTNYSTVEFYSRDVAGNQDGPRSLTNRDYPGLILAHNPVGYWRLNDAPGSAVAVDLGSGRNDGTYKGAPYFDSPPPLLNQPGVIVSDPDTSAFLRISNNTGPHAKAKPTQDNYVEVAPSSNQVPYDLTLEAWFTHPPGQQQYSVIAGKMSPAPPALNGGYGIYWWGHQLHFYINSVYERVSAPIAPSATNWRHVVGTYSRTAGIMTIYLDGVAVTSVPKSNPINVAATAPFRIGKGPYLGWVGHIDEVALYKDALTADDVRLHYERGRLSAQ